MVHLFGNIFGVFSVLMQGFCLQYFYTSFLESRRLKSRFFPTGVCVAVFYAIFQMSAAYMLSEDYGTARTFERLVLAVLLLIVLACCFYKAVKIITVFLIVTFLAVNEISFFLSYMVLMIGSRLMDIWVWCLDNGIVFFTENIEILTEITFVLSQLFMYTAYALLLYFSLKKAAEYFCEKDMDIRGTELCFLVLPGLVGLFICVFLRIIVITVNDGTAELLFDRYPVLLFLVPLILLLSLFSILCGVKLFQDMLNLNRERSSRIILEKQVENLEEHLGEVERIHCEIRGMKHDMKNTISVILRLAAEKGEKEDEQFEVYLSDLNRSMDRLDFAFQTGNGVADILLDMKYHDIVRDIPDFTMDAEGLLFPPNMAVHGYDLGIILGNALDNAMEACRKLKQKKPEKAAFVRLSSFVKGKLLFIEIENSFDGTVIRKKGAEFPVTDKKDSGIHGMGLINMKKAVEKYFGAVDWSVNNHIFTLSIMMKNERREENGV